MRKNKIIKVIKCLNQPGCSCDDCIINEEIRKVKLESKCNTSINCNIDLLATIFSCYFFYRCIAIYEPNKEGMIICNLDDNYNKDLILQTILTAEQYNKYKINLSCLCVLKHRPDLFLIIQYSLEKEFNINIELYPNKKIFIKWNKDNKSLQNINNQYFIDSNKETNKIKIMSEDYEPGS